MKKTAAHPAAALQTLSCRPGASLLSDVEMRGYVQQLPGWDWTDGKLQKTFRFANYYETMAFVNAIAFVAHRQDHHPDLSVHYNRVVTTFSTHDAGGVTLNDCICAARVEQLAGAP